VRRVAKSAMMMTILDLLFKDVDEADREAETVTT
jgi:hypothetical protein